MTQAELIFTGPIDLATPADELDAWLRDGGLPYETVVGGERRCRHHPSAQIRSRGEPCPACRAEGCGLGAPAGEGEP